MLKIIAPPPGEQRVPPSAGCSKDSELETLSLRAGTTVRKWRFGSGPSVRGAQPFSFCFSNGRAGVRRFFYLL